MPILALYRQRARLLLKAAEAGSNAPPAKDKNVASAAKLTGLAYSKKYPRAVYRLQRDIVNERGPKPDREDETLNIEDLILTQDKVDRDEVEDLRDSSNKSEPISVIEFDGKLYVADGHHRTCAAVLEDEDTIRADVWELE